MKTTLKIVKSIKTDLIDYSIWKKKIKNKRYTPTWTAGGMIRVYNEGDIETMQSNAQTLYNYESDILEQITHLKEYNIAYANNLKAMFYSIY